MVHVLLVLIAIGLLLWLEETYLPVAQPIKKIIRIVVVVGVVLYLLDLTGFLDYIDIPFPRLFNRHY